MLPASIFGTLLYSTALLPIRMPLYYLLLAPCLSLWYSSIFYWLPAYPYGTLLPSTGHCLYQWNSTIFYSIPAYTYVNLLSSTAFTYDTLLPSSGSLNILMVIYYLLLANCLSLWHFITFNWPTAYSTIVYWLHAYPN